jgi:ABC-type Mn2+/Zn2+ transport system ATPase subunit
LDGVSVGYGAPAILADVSLRIDAGSFVALLGANGSGKSTLLRTLAGILPPLSGRVVCARGQTGELRLGYVPQRETLDPLFLVSGFDVARMGAFHRVRPGRFAPRDETEHVAECLRLTGAEGFAAQPFAELSGGQKQRVLIARALVAQPDLLLLDEPTAGIDTAAAQAIMEVLERLHRARGLAILLVSHDLPTVRRHVRDAIWLYRGRLLHGTVADLLTPEKIEELLELALG